MSKAKITVTVEKSLIENLDLLSERLKKSRSHLVEEAIRAWQNLKRKQELIEGYQTMARENVETAESFLSAGTEVLK